MQQAAFALGIMPAEFWAMTPDETLAFISSRTDRIKRELVSQAYLTARLMRAKRFPPLEQVLGLRAAQPLEGEALKERQESETEGLKPVVTTATSRLRGGEGLPAFARRRIVADGP
jgi:hypothetical protein